MTNDRDEARNRIILIFWGGLGSIFLLLFFISPDSFRWTEKVVTNFQVCKDKTTPLQTTEGVTLTLNYQDVRSVLYLCGQLTTESNRVNLHFLIWKRNKLIYDVHQVSPPGVFYEAIPEKTFIIPGQYRLVVVHNRDVLKEIFVVVEKSQPHKQVPRLP